MLLCYMEIVINFFYDLTFGEWEIVELLQRMSKKLRVWEETVK